MQFKVSINEINSLFAYIVEHSSTLWHATLGNLNIYKHSCITFKKDHNDKYEICIEAKMTRKPFLEVERNSKLLKLVHSNIVN